MVYCVRKLNGTIDKGHKLIKTPNMKGFHELAFLSEVACIGWDQMVTETFFVLGTSNLQIAI